MGSSSSTTYCKESVTPLKVPKMWLRQKSPDKATWKILRSLIKRNFCSCDNTIQSQFQLESWTYQTNQFSKKYRFLYSPALHEIYYKQRKKIVSWFTKDARWTTITKNVDSQETISSIPADAHPIKLINEDIFYIKWITDPTLTNNQSLSLIDFILTKPE